MIFSFVFIPVQRYIKKQKLTKWSKNEVKGNKKAPPIGGALLF